VSTIKQWKLATILQPRGIEIIDIIWVDKLQTGYVGQTREKLRFLSLLRRADWHRDYPQWNLQKISLWRPVPGIWGPHTQKRVYCVLSPVYLFPRPIYLIMNYKFHHNSRRQLDSAGCGRWIWSSFPSHYPQEIFICHCTPDIQSCRCAVPMTAGYIKLPTKCDNPKGEP
jgi:hypothetical protein